MAATLVLALGIGILAYLSRTPPPAAINHGERLAKAPATVTEEAARPDTEKFVAEAPPPAPTPPAASAPSALASGVAPAAPAGPAAAAEAVAERTDSTRLNREMNETSGRKVAEEPAPIVAKSSDLGGAGHGTDYDGDGRGFLAQDDLSGSPAIPGNSPVAKASPAAVAFGSLVLHDESFRLATTNESTAAVQPGFGLLNLRNGDGHEIATANNWNVTVNSGAPLQLGAANVIPGAAPLVIEGSDARFLDKRLAFALTRDGLRPMDASGPSDLTLSKVGGGTLTLSGVNAYTGGTAVQGGTLSVNLGGGALLLNGGTVVNNKALAVNGSGRLGISGTDGAWSVAAANAYTGSTHISAGIVAFQDDRAGAGESSFKVASAASLGDQAKQAANPLVLANTAGVSMGGTLDVNGVNQTLSDLDLNHEKGRESGAGSSGGTSDLGGQSQSVDSAAGGKAQLGKYSETAGRTDKDAEQKAGIAAAGGMGGGGGRGGGQRQNAAAATESLATMPGGADEQAGALRFNGTISGSSGGMTKTDTIGTPKLGNMVVTKPAAGTPVLSANDISKAGSGAINGPDGGLTLSGVSAAGGTITASGTFTNANAGGTISGLSGTGGIVLDLTDQAHAAATVVAKGEAGPAPTDHFATEGKGAFALPHPTRSRRPRHSGPDAGGGRLAAGRNRTDRHACRHERGRSLGPPPRHPEEVREQGRRRQEPRRHGRLPTRPECGLRHRPHDRPVGPVCRQRMAADLDRPGCGQRVRRPTRGIPEGGGRTECGRGRRVLRARLAHGRRNDAGRRDRPRQPLPVRQPRWPSRMQ